MAALVIINTTQGWPMLLTSSETTIQASVTHNRPQKLETGFPPLGIEAQRKFSCVKFESNFFWYLATRRWRAKIPLKLPVLNKTANSQISVAKRANNILELLELNLLFFSLQNIAYIIEHRSLDACRVSTSNWRPFGPLDFILRALWAVRPFDQRNGDWIVC